MRLHGKQRLDSLSFTRSEILEALAVGRLEARGLHQYTPEDEIAAIDEVLEAAPDLSPVRSHSSGETSDD